MALAAQKTRFLARNSARIDKGHILYATSIYLSRGSVSSPLQLSRYARILKFDPEKGAAYYCAKYVTKQFGEWDLSDNVSAFWALSTNSSMKRKGQQVERRRRSLVAQTAVHEWMTAAEAARHLRAKRRTLLLWVRQGKLQAFALSGTKRHIWRFRRADLDRFLLAHPVIPSASPTVLPKERGAI